MDDRRRAKLCEQCVVVFAGFSRNDATKRNNIQREWPNPTTQHQAFVKVDNQVNGRQSITGRYRIDRNLQEGNGIGGLIAQGSDPYAAAVTEVYVHGAAGRRISERLGDSGLLAGDLLPEIPLVMNVLRQGGL